MNILDSFLLIESVCMHKYALCTCKYHHESSIFPWLPMLNHNLAQHYLHASRFFSHEGTWAEHLKCLTCRSHGTSINIHPQKPTSPHFNIYLPWAISHACQSYREWMSSLTPVRFDFETSSDQRHFKNMVIANLCFISHLISMHKGSRCMFYAL